MRPSLAVLATLSLLAVLAAPAVASCAPPAPVAESAARAVAVVYGTVTSSSGGAVTLRVDRVLKGSAGSSVTLFVGPARPGVPGSGVATSIDYAATVGTDHVLYLVHGADGQLETNACIGSHPGPPTAEELAYFGAPTSATPSPAATPQSQVPPSMPDGPAQTDVVWMALAALAGAAAVIVLARRVLLAR